MIKNKTYDVLKEIALRVLPAIAFITLSICDIWNIPYGVQIGQTLAAIETGLGILLGISSYKYNKIAAEFENEENKSHEVEE